MEIKISERAKRDLASILSYLELRNPVAAERLSHELETRILSLAEFPRLGRKRTRFGNDVRNLVAGHHLIFYRIDESEHLLSDRRVRNRRFARHRWAHGCRGRVAPMTSPHFFPVRVYYEDTDCSGLVYHASHLRFMERGRTELLRELGVGQRALLEGEAGAMFFVVRTMTIDFKKPAHMDDLLTVETLVDDVAGASVVLTQRIRRGEEILASASVTVVAVQNGRPRRLPPRVREKFASALRRTD